MAGLELFSWAGQASRTVNAPVPQNPCKLPADPPSEALRVRDVLVLHVGRDAAITAPMIAAQAGLWPNLRAADRGTKVRELITAWYEALQLDGHVLVATDDGFFHTSDAADLTRQCRSLRSRAAGLFWRLRRIKLRAQSMGFIYHGQGHWSR